ncbi:hypothetical protein KR044_007747 [Drosophila immigrans]|nr:hypothetical protein KR044_007747 [Drosophila immigrans]
MTYSHNSVRNNIKMTTASATKSIRLKKGATTPPPAPAPVSPTTSIESTSTTVAISPIPSETAHSNSIATSTNLNHNNNHHFHQQQSLSTSPTLCSPSITPNNRPQQRLHSQSTGANNQRTRQQQQQRQSPQQMSGGGGGGFFFANNCKRNGGNGGGRSPQQGTTTLVRQSPATILGGGFSPGAGAGVLVSGAGGSARKQRRSPTTISSTIGFGAGGKISPQHHLIPTALTHFAGSKCFDAPAPTALPKPPQHWTLTKSEEKLVSSSAGPTLQSLLRGERCSASKLHLNNSTGGGYVVKSSKRNLLDDFDTHNLKLLLNVQS